MLLRTLHCNYYITFLILFLYVILYQGKCLHWWIVFYLETKNRYEYVMGILANSLSPYIIVVPLHINCIHLNYI